MNRKTLKALSILSAAVLFSGIFVTPSQARITLASSGRAVLPGDYACFWLSASGMTNNCSTEKTLEMPLVIDTGGSFTVRINVHSPSVTSKVKCEAIAVSPDTFHSVSSGILPDPSPAGDGVIGVIVLPISVPAGWALFEHCFVPQGGSVYTIAW